jgi:hypothetical protein
LRAEVLRLAGATTPVETAHGALGRVRAACPQPLGLGHNDPFKLHWPALVKNQSMYFGRLGEAIELRALGSFPRTP